MQNQVDLVQEKDSRVEEFQHFCTDFYLMTTILALRCELFLTQTLNTFSGFEHEPTQEALFLIRGIVFSKQE